MRATQLQQVWTLGGLTCSAALSGLASHQGGHSHAGQGSTGSTGRRQNKRPNKTENPCCLLLAPPPPDLASCSLQSTMESYLPEARRGGSSYLCPLPLSGSSHHMRNRPCPSPPDASYCSPNGPYLPLYSRPFSVSELRWEFDWYLKHPLRQAQTPPPSQYHSKLCPYFCHLSLSRCFSM